MNKVYQRVVWENYPSENTPINEINLNRMDYAIDTIDDRVVGFDTTKANQTDLLQSLKDITYNDSTGVFTFTWWNGSSREVDLNIEKIPVSFSMSAQGILTMTTADDTKFTADIASLIKLYTFNDSTDIRFNTVTDKNGNKIITAFIVDGSVTEKKLQPNFLADCRAEVSGAKEEAENAEAWARGTRAGTTVSNTDETYQNNAKYFSEKSSDYSEDSEAWARGSRNGTDVSASDETYNNNSMYYSALSERYKDIAYGYVEEVEQKGQEAVEAIENAYDVAAPEFLIDFTTGHLMYQGGRFTFQVNESNGHLEWGMTV